MSRIDDLMADEMAGAARASGLFGEPLTLYNFTDENTDSSDAPDWTKDAGEEIEGHVDWQQAGNVEDTIGGEEVDADANLYVPLEYDVRDGRRSDERASVIETSAGDEFRVELAREEGGVWYCPSTLRVTDQDASF